MQETKKETPEKETKKRKKKIRISDEEYTLLKEKVSQAELLYDKYLRLQAEFENTQKRHLKEKEEYLRFAHGAIVQELLPIYDHFVMALSNLNAQPKEESNHNVILQGVQMIQNELWELLSRNGLSKIETVGKPFNSQIHEAMATVFDDTKPEGIVVEEVRPGYLLNGKLLRPASVKITKKEPATEGSPERPKEVPSEAEGQSRGETSDPRESSAEPRDNQKPENEKLENQKPDLEV